MIGGDTMRRRSPGRDVASALALKAALLLALYLACFGPAHRVAVTPARVAAAFAIAAPPH
jgi:hypothetical protein